MEVNEIATMTFREVDSKSELLEILRSRGGQGILLGSAAESPRRSYLLELDNKEGAHVEIGMVLSYHGITPSWILSADQNSLAIGHDCTISFVDLRKQHLVATQALDAPFYQFLPECGSDHFAVLHELGVDRFDYSGIRLWSVASPDIARSAYFRDEKSLVLQHGPSDELLIDVETGVSKLNISGSNASITLLQNAYAAFNARDLDGALATMQPNVIWPNGMEGGVVHGHDGVRAYWTRQWAMINPHVDPVGFHDEDSGKIAVSVHQVVRDLSGKVLMDRMVEHVYTVKDGLIQSMDIRE